MEESGQSPFIRFRMEPQRRVTVVSLTGMFSGAVAGGYLGARNAGWQYLAERAHNLPTTVPGWYYYHKWKNYRMILVGIKKATSYGLKIGAVTAVYECLEATIDKEYFGYSCSLSSIFSGFLTSLMCASIARLPISSFKRLVFMGTLGGTSIGLAQDLLTGLETKSVPEGYRRLYDRIKHRL